MIFDFPLFCALIPTSLLSSKLGFNYTTHQWICTNCGNTEQAVCSTCGCEMVYFSLHYNALLRLVVCVISSQLTQPIKIAHSGPENLKKSRQKKTHENK